MTTPTPDAIRDAVTAEQMAILQTVQARRQYHAEQAKAWSERHADVVAATHLAARDALDDIIDAILARAGMAEEPTGQVGGMV